MNENLDFKILVNRLKSDEEIYINEPTDGHIVKLKLVTLTDDNLTIKYGIGWEGYDFIELVRNQKDFEEFEYNTDIYCDKDGNKIKKKFTKEDLIDYLNTIEGNPEIKVWNGLVEDYTGIEGIDKLLLMRRSKEVLTHDYEFELHQSTRTFNVSEEQAKNIKIKVDKHYPNQEWEIPNRFCEPENLNKMYGESKEFLAIYPAIEGKRYQDRLGTINY